MNIFDLLKIAIELGASDIHITVESPPIARIKGKFIKLTDKILINTILKKWQKN